MAERRRIIPASVGPLFKDQKETKTTPALRLELTLGETTEETCPEFAYPVLVKNAGGRDDTAQSLNDIDEEDRVGLAAIAKKFEEKYAPTKKAKRKHRMQLEDLLDAGMGYDETDPFVDNSECYDELVPASLTTQFGGFYINSGQLKFKEVLDSDDGEFQSKKNKSPKKKRKKSLENGERKKEKRKLSSDSGGAGEHISKKVKKHLQKKLREEKKKKKKSVPHMIRTPTVAELLKQKAEHSPKSHSMPASSMNGTAATTTVKHHKHPSSSLTVSSIPPAVASSCGVQNIDATLDLGISVADMNMDNELMGMVAETLAAMNGNEPCGDGAGIAGGVAGAGGSDSEMNVSPVIEGAEDGPKEMISLPPGLPLQLVDNIQKIKEAARKSVEVKSKFFTPSVNNLLLRIEHAARELICSKRSAVYGHLASHLPCTKDTLLKRAKKLRLGAQDSQLREPLQKLREAIAEVMPEHERLHHEECHKALYNKTLDSEKEKEGKSSDTHKPPKKKFIWTDRLRKLLCDVVRVKVKTFEISKSRTQSAEEYLKAFLDAEVKPLWPKEWIQTRNLFKESREVHDHMTSIAPKQRKVMPMVPRKLVMAKKGPGEDGEESLMNYVPSTTAAQEAEPSSTQVPEMVGSPLTAQHLQDVPSLMEFVGSGEDSMDSAITSSQYKGMDYGTTSSDSNREVSPALGSRDPVHDIPGSSLSPLPNLDPSFIVDQLISQQLVTGSQGDDMGVSGTDVRSIGLSSSGQNVTTGTTAASGRVMAGPTESSTVSKGSTLGASKPKSGVISGSNLLPKQIGTDFITSQQSYAAKLSAISNVHAMRTLHAQGPGLQAKDVTSSSSGGVQAAGSKIRPTVTVSSAPKKDIPVSQPIIRLMRDTTIDKMTAQPSSRLKLQTASVHQKVHPSSTVLKTQTVKPAVGGPLAMSYSQTLGSTSIQGRSSKVSSPRMSVSGSTDSTSLPQMPKQSVAPGDGNIRVSPSRTTSQRTPYVPAASAQQQRANLQGAVSAFSSPTTASRNSTMSQSPSTRTQQTSPSGGQKPSSYSPTSQQYPHQHVSPGHTSPVAYSTYPSMSGSYQQVSMGDMSRKQSPGGGNFPNNYPMAATQSSTQGGLPQSPGDAVITGPAPGTFFHTQAAADPRYAGDNSQSQHRIH